MPIHEDFRTPKQFSFRITFWPNQRDIITLSIPSNSVIVNVFICYQKPLFVNKNLMIWENQNTVFLHISFRLEWACTQAPLWLGLSAKRCRATVSSVTQWIRRAGWRVTDCLGSSIAVPLLTGTCRMCINWWIRNHVFVIVIVVFDKQAKSLSLIVVIEFVMYRFA